MKVYECNTGTPWVDKKEDEIRTYKFIYISETEQYIVFSDGEVAKYDTPYPNESISKFLKNKSWKEVELKIAFE